MVESVTLSEIRIHGQSSAAHWMDLDAVVWCRVTSQKERQQMEATDLFSKTPPFESFRVLYWREAFENDVLRHLNALLRSSRSRILQRYLKSSNQSIDDVVTKLTKRRN